MSHTQTRSLFAVLALVVASVALPVLPALAANKIYISEIAYADNTVVGESVALEYSRYNYNVTNFYDPSPFRSSDHDPTIVDFDLK